MVMQIVGTIFQIHSRLLDSATWCILSDMLWVEEAEAGEIMGTGEKDGGKRMKKKILSAMALCIMLGTVTIPVVAEEAEQPVVQSEESEDTSYVPELAREGGPILQKATGKLPQVTGLKAEAYGKNKVRISWDAVKDADGYIIYRKVGDGNAVYCYMVSKTDYIDNTASDVEYNFYFVYPYYMLNGERVTTTQSAYVYEKGVTTAVTGLKASSAVNAVKLSWNKTEGADGYLVYGMVSGGEYHYIGMTKGGLSYTDKNASTEEYNFYWVFPYHYAKSGKMIPGKTAKYVYGKALEQVKPVNTTVYWVPNGKSYHVTRNCPTLKRSKKILEGTKQQAFAAGKTDPCNVCVKN